MRVLDRHACYRAIARPNIIGHPVVTSALWVRSSRVRLEMLFGHVKGEWPHPDKLRGRGKLDAELDRAQAEYNTLDSETPQSVVQRPSATRPDNGRLSGTSACDA